MLLAIDIGNSAIKFGVFDGEKLVSRFSIPTKRGKIIAPLADVGYRSLDHPITAAIACSVVPQADEPVKHFVRECLGIQTFFVDNTFDFGLRIQYATISTLGSDRLVNAFAATEKYGTPVIVCSLGTATTIDLVSEGKEYLGGVIAPGMQTMGEALHRLTAQLPQVEVTKPVNVIGASTVTSIQSGVFYGYVSLVDGLIGRISDALELPQQPIIVATGGLAQLIAAEITTIVTVDENLLLDGLRILSQQVPSLDSHDSALAS